MGKVRLREIKELTSKCTLGRNQARQAQNPTGSPGTLNPRPIICPLWRACGQKEQKGIREGETSAAQLASPCLLPASPCPHLIFFDLPLPRPPGPIFCLLCPPIDFLEGYTSWKQTAGDKWKGSDFLGSTALPSRDLDGMK